MRVKSSDKWLAGILTAALLLISVSEPVYSRGTKFQRSRLLFRTEIPQEFIVVHSTTNTRQADMPAIFPFN